MYAHMNTQIPFSEDPQALHSTAFMDANFKSRSIFPAGLVLEQRLILGVGDLNTSSDSFNITCCSCK